VIYRLVFVIVGVFGLSDIRNIRKMKLQYRTPFYGVILIALGLGYYQLFSNMESLV